MTEPVSLTEQEIYWKNILAGPLPVLSALFDHPRPPVKSFILHQSSRQLPPPTTDDLYRFCRQHHCSLFELLAGAAQTLFTRLTGQEILLGVLSPDSLDAAGQPFVNPVALRLPSAEGRSWLDFLAAVNRTVAEATRHRDYPFAQMVRQVIPDAFRLEHAPVFQLMLVLLNQPNLGQTPVSPADLARVRDITAVCDVTLVAVAEAGSLRLECEYDAELFDPPAIERLLARLEVLLVAILVQPERPVAALPLVTPAERRQLLEEWNATQVDYPHRATIPQLFEAQAARTPEVIALAFAGQVLTYRHLEEQANRLARYLRHLGVGPEVLVGLFVERSLEMVVAMLAVLKAGGAYVPLDTAYPAERLALMQADARYPVILTQSSLLSRLPSGEARAICLDTAWPQIMAESAAPLPPQAGADNLAYVMYTSGSTGRPKGIAAIHQGVVRLLQGANYAPMGPDETFLQLAPIAFDAATFEIWGALLHGGRLVIYPPQPPSLAELAAAIETLGITTLWLTTGLFHQMAEAHPDSLQKMRHVMTGGDVMQVALVKKIGEMMNRVGHRLTVFYGPTENTTFSSFYPVTNPAAITDSVPLGRPIANSQMYVLDPWLQPLPVGVIGEIYVGGGLARGYLHQPALTAAGFIPHPFSAEPGARLYRSGDLGRYLPTGEVEFMGRSDHQVKVRGFRVELTEIETVLGRHPAVAEAVVLARRKADGPKYLAAYIVPATVPPAEGRVSFSQPATDLRRELHGFLQSKLPAFMLPSAYVFIEAIPLTPHNKIDREALPMPDWDRPELAEAYESPRTPLEEMLAELWGEVLGLERVGLQDDFFALGGHSLLATQLISRIQKLFKINLPLSSLFETPTLLGLAQTMLRYETQPGQIEAIARLRQKIKAMSPAERQAALAQHRPEQGSN